MKKKGFTLVELLAVIVVLAIIALIAVPIVLNVISKSKKGAAIDSAYSYVDAVEKYIVMHDMDESKYPIDLKSGEIYQVSSSTYTETSSINLIEKVYAEDNIILNDIIKIKGTKPNSGVVTISEKRKVGKAILIIDSYKVICEDGKCNIDGVAANSEDNSSKFVSVLVGKANSENVTSYSAGETAEMYTFNHDATAQTEVLTDYRYIGSTPNNYIIFNNEVWRIIGMFTLDGEQKVKIVRNESIGTNAWDNGGSNNWLSSSLNTYLNKDYKNSLSTTAQSQIVETTYYLGGISNYKSSGNDLYIQERGGSSYIKSYIAIMYPSDYIYGYANEVDDACYNNAYDSCADSLGKDTNWLYKSINEWLLSPHATVGFRASMVYSNGQFRDINGGTYASQAVRPVVYLKSNVGYKSGDGSSDNPYIIE